MHTEKASDPIAIDLVLVGGGHSHALLLRMVGMKPMPGVQITLVSDVSEAPYSGMLPGHIAGFYTHEEAHIDLRKLCVFAGARFVHATVVGMDPGAREVFIEGRAPLSFDLVSINIGSTPSWGGVPGAAEFATPSKPVPELLERWESIKADPSSVQNLVIVGGGAGGVELALAMEKQLGGGTCIRLIHAGEDILRWHNQGVRDRLGNILGERGIEVILQERVTEVEASAVRISSGIKIPADAVFWVTQACAPAWLAEAGFPVDEGGFLMVDQTLQVKGFPQVFAAGDIASIQRHPRPKSGVFAVRTAKPLLRNLRRLAAGKLPLRWSPQKRFLSLIGTADGSAVASRRFLAHWSPAMWKWKDWIDRRFMRRFSLLPSMGTAAAGEAGGGGSEDDDLKSLRRRAAMRCSGCAAKVGSPVLARVMERIRKERPAGRDFPQVVAGIDDPDDAAILVVPPRRHLVQTIDYIPEIIGDPYLFGRIAANHCMSDIFAMGAEAHSALCLVLAPFGAESAMEELLFQALAGMTRALDSMGVPLVGGHTAEGDRLALGISANGFIRPDRANRKGGLREGDLVILTKALGVGCLFAAEMRHEAEAGWIDRAVDSMLSDNQRASEVLREHGADAMTDVTGFGLLGHLAEMLKTTTRESKSAGDGVSVELLLDHLPLLPGAAKVARRGILSSLHHYNRSAFEVVGNVEEFTRHEAFPLLVDPQTSGGLLAGVPEKKAADAVEELVAAGYAEACVVGRVMAGKGDFPIALA